MRTIAVRTIGVRTIGVRTIGVRTIGVRTIGVRTIGIALTVVVVSAERTGCDPLLQLFHFEIQMSHFVFTSFHLNCSNFV